ncbi:phage repressor [Flavobacterium sp. F52]|uniref:phage repressor n=1 Tax=Flavobacterium sp. F52 TaxID=1202532 RepID=UPI000272DFBA|nr:phage repressor [Flavobacterium sp. F52]EJG02258.1 phage repressor [Flavobacterium sp. F52]
MKAINRFIKYCDFKGIAPSRFEKNYGLSNGYFSIQLKRNGSLGEDVLKIIIDNCQEIDAEWLITGKGNMLKKQLTPSENSNQSDKNEKEVARLLIENRRLEETNDLLRFKITTLENQLSEGNQIKNSPIIHTPMAESKPELTKKNQKK